MKVKASILIFALIILFICSVLIGLLFTYININQKIALREYHKTQTFHNFESAVLLLENESSIIPNNDSISIDLFNEGNDSVTISRYNWGIFDWFKIDAHYQGFHCTKSGIITFQTGEPEYSLYLSQISQPLVLCGQTKIEGTAFLPLSGVKRGYIEGQYYNGEKLIYGIQKQSDRRLKNVREELLESIVRTLQHNYEYTTNTPISSIETQTNNSLYTCELPKYSVLNSGLFPPTLFWSDSVIEIGPNTNCNNCIFTAPKVIVKSNFSQPIQIFARDSIIIESNVKLLYPSALVLDQRASTIDLQGEIIVKRKSILEGVILQLSREAYQRNPTLVTIEKDSKLIGSLYCEGYCQLKGTVEGTLATNQFYLKTNAAIYINHILSGTIIPLRQSPELVIPQLFEKTGYEVINYF